MTFKARFLAALLVALVSLAAAPGPTALAQTAQPQTQASRDEQISVRERLDRWDVQARTVERRIEQGGLGLEDIAAMRTSLDHQLAEIPQMREIVRGRLVPLQQQVEALGEPPEDPAAEAPQIAAERQRLANQVADLEARMRRLDQAQARAEGLVNRLGQLRQKLFTAQLLTRGPSVLNPSVFAAGVEEIARTANRILSEFRERLAREAMSPQDFLPSALLLVVVVGLPFLLSRLRNMAIRRLVESVDDDTPESRRVAVGVGLTVVRLFLPATTVALVLGALSLSGLVGPLGMLFVTGLGKAAAIGIGAYALGGAYFQPNAPQLRLSRLDNRRAAAAHSWLIVLAAVVGLDRAIVLQAETLGMGVEGLTLLNTAGIALGGVALAQFVRYNRPPKRPAVEPVRTDAPVPGDEEDEEEGGEGRQARTSLGPTVTFLMRGFALVAAVGAPILAVAGYYAGARYAFFPLVFSGAVIGLCLLLFHVVRAIVEQVSAAEPGRETAIDRLRLIPIAVGFLLGTAALPLLALIWGADVNDLSVVWRQVQEGFALGEVTISPLDILFFIAVLVVGIIVTRRVQALLRRSVLPLTGLDAGGRDAVAAGAGYVGIVIAALVAISSAGLDLSNLAIVAGALSVGIGFGLQNIVNNFVSGVILLIERPIKAGDWIQLPTGMGYVKTINVRSTEVETFDRASMFVPNSQLISDVVINWTHSNLNGRVIAPVRVDYSADPRKVERILLEIARAHPLMLRRPAPFVLFRAFGPDGMEFEIRGILRDVNWVLNVQSDINFEITRRFAEEGIGVAVSRTELSFRDAQGLGAALRGAGDEAEREGPTGPRPPSRLHDEPARDPAAEGPGDAR